MRWVAALGGALLAVALFLPWYRFDWERTTREAYPSQPRGDDRYSSGVLGLLNTFDDDVSAWQAFTVVDVVLALAAVVAIAAALIPRLRVVAAVLATTGAALVVIRIAEHAGPDSSGGVSFYPSPTTGAWLALAGALVAAVAGWASLRRGS